MKLLLKRKYFKGNYTIGDLFVEGVFICNTLEDHYRDLSKEAKVYGETAIPFGTYDIILNRSPKFKRDLPRLIDVPYFSGVLIHRGNRAKDSAGCILVGENKQPGMVINSTGYETMLVQMMQEVTLIGENIEIEITK